MRGWRWGLLAVCLGLDGCAGIAAHYIETPGHHGPRPGFTHWLGENTDYTRHEFTTAGGLRIAYWYSPPTRFDIAPDVEEQRDSQHYSLTFDFDLEKTGGDEGQPPLLGSVVLLHPWGQNAAQMAFWGVYFSNAGYVTVLPALRSQGDSGDAPVGYGPREAGDVVQLVHDLQQRGELPPPIYLFGVSYGATVALFAAPELPRVRGVVALEPYVHPVDVIMRAPKTGWFAPKWLARFFPPTTMRKGIARADRDLGVDLATIDPGDALAASTACTLLLRGDRDILISGHALQDLAGRSPRAVYARIPGEGHVTLFFRSDLLAAPILTWMHDTPATLTAPCPAWNPAAVRTATHPPRDPRATGQRHARLPARDRRGVASL